MILVTSHLKGILDHLRLHKALFRKAPLQPIRRHGRATVSLHRNDTIQHLQSNTEPAQPSCRHSGGVDGQGVQCSGADLFVFVDYQGGKGLVRVLGIGVMRFDGAEFDFPVPVRELFQDPVQHRALRDVVLVEVDEAVDVLGGVGHFFDSCAVTWRRPPNLFPFTSAFISASLEGGKPAMVKRAGLGSDIRRWFVRWKAPAREGGVCGCGGGRVVEGSGRVRGATPFGAIFLKHSRVEVIVVRKVYSRRRPAPSSLGIPRAWVGLI
jgi:hypothetical protein